MPVESPKIQSDGFLGVALRLAEFVGKALKVIQYSFYYGYSRRYFSDPMARFKPYDYSQGLMIPINLDEQIEPGTFEFALHHLIEARYDESFPANEFSKDETGRPAYPPKLMLKAILFAYSQGILSSRKIERACKTNIRFMALLCGEGPDHSTTADLTKKSRQTHRKSLCRRPHRLSRRGPAERNPLRPRRPQTPHQCCQRMEQVLSPR